jgi:hypothetical protein
MRLDGAGTVRSLSPENCVKAGKAFTFGGTR